MVMFHCNDKKDYLNGSNLNWTRKDKITSPELVLMQKQL